MPTKLTQKWIRKYRINPKYEEEVKKMLEEERDKMRTLKEIEAKIESIRGELAGAHSQQIAPNEESDRLEGWLVGLGMAKGIGLESRNENVFQANIQSAHMHRENPKTPYEQGIKEALKFCLEDD